MNPDPGLDGESEFPDPSISGPKQIIGTVSGKGHKMLNFHMKKISL